MDAIDTVEYKGHTIKVYIDEDPMNPREWDNLGTMTCWHGRYRLGDKHDWKEPKDFMDSEEAKGAEILPLYLYDHSGITIRTSPFSCPWDSGQVGYIYVTKARLKEEYGSALTQWRKKAREVMEGEVEVYDKYLTGGFVGYVIEGPHCDDSCWGFDDKDYMITEAKNNIDAAIKHATDYQEFQSLLT